MNYDLSNKVKIIYNMEYDYYKIIALENIQKGEIILNEKPLFNLFGKKNNNYMLQMLYIMLKNNENHYILNLYPRNKIELINNDNPYNINLIKIINNYNDNKTKRFLLSFDKSTLYLYYYKYLFNAFDMNNSPVILPIGALMNHSCTPNIIFYEHNNTMLFETLHNIKKGSELCYSYLRNYKSKTNINKHTYLINHYNFICKCD